MGIYRVSGLAQSLVTSVQVELYSACHIIALSMYVYIKVHIYQATCLLQDNVCVVTHMCCVNTVSCMWF